MAFVADDEIQVTCDSSSPRSAEHERRRSVVEQQEFLLELLEERRQYSSKETEQKMPLFDPELIDTWKDSMRLPRVRTQLVRLLSKTLIFAGTSESFRTAIVDAVEPVEYKPGQVVFRHREVGDWMGIIISGRLERKLQRLEHDIPIADVGPGGVVGDLGLFCITPMRSFTVTAVKSSVLLVLPREKYEQSVAQGRCPRSLSLFCEASSMRSIISDTESFLKLRCFQGLDPDFVMALAENSEPRLGYPNQVLMKEGHFGDEMFILRSGSVKIWKHDKFVVELPAGTVMGELAVLGADKRRTATVTCASLCLIRALHSEVFYDILKRFPSAKRVFDHAYVARLVSVQVNETKDEIHHYNTFYGSAQPKSSAEMKCLFGSTLKLQEQRQPAQTLPPLSPRAKRATP